MGVSLDVAAWPGEVGHAPDEFLDRYDQGSDYVHQVGLPLVAIVRGSRHRKNDARSTTGTAPRQPTSLQPG